MLNIVPISCSKFIGMARRFQTIEASKKSRAIIPVQVFCTARFYLVLVMFFGDPILQYSSSILVVGPGAK
jgi:hypothetical protein